MKINFDQQLKEKLLNGDKEAFTQTVELCKEFVYASAMGIVRNNHDAEDITQDVFTLLYKKRETIKLETNIPVWLYTSSVFISKKLLRNKSTSLKHEKKVKPMNVNDSSKNELSEIVLEELSSLSLKYRDVLFRHYVLGEKYKEIALHLGVNLSTVSMQIKRGLNLLKSNLGKKGYTVSSLIIIGIVSNPEAVFASCKMSSSAITNASINPNSTLNVYSPGKDSIAFQAYSSKTATNLHGFLFLLLALTSLSAAIYYYLAETSSNQTKKSNKPKAISTKQFPLEDFKQKIWNHKNNNLSELHSANRISIHHTNPITKTKYVGTSKNIAYITIPKKLTSIPTKITLKLKHRNSNFGTLGSVIVTGHTVPAFDKWRYKANLKAHLKSQGDMTIFLLNKTKIVTIRNKVSGMSKYQFDFKSHQVCLVINNVDIYEIKFEQMTPQEIIDINQKINDYEKEERTHFAPQIIPH